MIGGWVRKGRLELFANSPFSVFWWMLPPQGRTNIGAGLGLLLLFTLPWSSIGLAAMCGAVCCLVKLLLRRPQMTDARHALVVATFLALSSFALAADSGSTVTVSGWVIDSACAYTKGLDKPIGPACAKACAKNGSPLVILRDDGTIFLPIDANTPSASQNAKLMAFAGERVTVTGKDYVRNGSHGLVIEKISK